MTPWAHLKSACSLAVITLNLLFWVGPLALLAMLKLVLPGTRGFVDPMMAGIYRAAVAVDDAWLEGVIGIRWQRPEIELEPGERLIVLSNHNSWSDILLLQSLLVREGPILKFLVKRELVWVPLLGLIFWALDFPILHRRARAGGSNLLRRERDLEALRRACQDVKGRPIALMNFVEGTRFGPEKHGARSSPYEHLLRPRSGGLHAMLEALRGEIDAVVDVTLVYDPPCSFWAFLSGTLGEVRVEAERLSPADVPSGRSALEAWLGERWKKKDAQIAAARRGRGEARAGAAGP